MGSYDLITHIERAQCRAPCEPPKSTGNPRWRSRLLEQWQSVILLVGDLGIESLSIVVCLLSLPVQSGPLYPKQDC